MKDDARTEIIAFVCWVLVNMAGRTVNSALLRGMTWDSAQSACRRRGQTPSGRWRYANDVSGAIRKLAKKHILTKLNGREWTVPLNIKGQDALLKDLL